MKKALLALSLIGCLLLSAVSCTNQDDKGEEKKAPTSDQTEVTTTADPDTDNNPSDGSGLENGGANTDSGYGPLHPVH